MSNEAEMTQQQAAEYNPFETPLYEDLEPGTYPMKVSGIEFKTTDKGRKLTWKLTVESGKGKGKSIYNDFIQTWNNPDAQRIGREQYRRALAAAGLYSPADVAKFKKVAKLVEEGTAEVVEVGPEGFPHMKAKNKMVLVTVAKDDRGYLKAKKIEGVKPELGDVVQGDGEAEPAF